MRQLHFDIAARTARRIAGAAAAAAAVSSCSAPKPRAPPDIAEVFIEPPSSNAAGGIAAPSRRPGQAEETCSAILALSYFSGDSMPGSGTIAARLSVIRPDGSLDRVILDPRVDFQYSPEGSSPGTWAPIPGCTGVPECNPWGIIASGREYEVMARPAPGSTACTGPPETSIRIRQARPGLMQP